MSGTRGRSSPRVEVHDAEALPRRAATVIAAALRDGADRRGVASLALSGGGTPRPMFAALATEAVPWDLVHVLQVDERVAPDGHDDRNLTDQRALLLDRVPIPEDRVHPMPVTAARPEEAAASYAATLRAVLGDSAVLDVVHLGLGDDGHTASLVPGDPALAVEDRLVAATEPYQGRRRLTLTRPVLRAARLQLWLVGGAGKADAVARMRAGDGQIPATGVLVDDALVLLDDAAAHG